METTINNLVNEIKRLLAKKPKILGSYPQSANKGHNWQVQWLDPKLPEKPPKFSDSLLADERQLMKQKMLEYFAQNLGNESAPIFLVQAVAGMGKSTTAIQVAQEIARMDYKVLYLMPRHDYWQDIINNPFYNEDYWLHWLSFDGINDEGQAMCRFPKAIKSLSLSGYKAVDGCKQLCGLHTDNYIAICPYRSQARSKKNIIAGVHNHLTTGLSIKFDLIIIDESVMSTMLTQRLVPAKFLIGEAVEPIVLHLMKRLAELSNERKVYNGFDLAHILQAELSVIFKRIKEDSISFEPPELPESFDEETQVKYWYVLDFLRLMAVEYQLWQSGESDGMSRVKLDGLGLTLYLKNDDFWQETPKIILDATGEASMLENLLGKEVIKHAPNIGLKGKIFQLANRLNNITAIYDKQNNKLTQNGTELQLMIKHIRHSKPLKSGYGKYNKVGLITFKSLKPFLEKYADIVLHFGGNRGTNVMENVDCLIIAGTPSPSDYDILNLANQMLFSDDLSAHSNIVGNRPYRNSTVKPYLFTKDQKQPYRLVSGYDNPVLESTLANFRESELIQSLYRARPLTNDCHIYLLTCVPLPDIWLDKLTENPNELINLPNVPLKMFAKLQKYCTGELYNLQKICSELNISKAEVYQLVQYNCHHYQVIAKDKELYFRGQLI